MHCDRVPMSSPALQGAFLANAHLIVLHGAVGICAVSGGVRFERVHKVVRPVRIYEQRADPGRTRRGMNSSGRALN